MYIVIGLLIYAHRGNNLKQSNFVNVIISYFTNRVWGRNSLRSRFNQRLLKTRPFRFSALFVFVRTDVHSNNTRASFPCEYPAPSVWQLIEINRLEQIALEKLFIFHFYLLLSIYCTVFDLRPMFYCVFPMEKSTVVLCSLLQLNRISLKLITRRKRFRDYNLLMYVC